MAIWTLLLPILILLPFLVFYFWMFWQMLNDYSLSPVERYYWTLGFVVLSIFAAGYYYLSRYRNK